MQAAGRTTTADQTVAGVDIGCGETVLACVAAANRDPAVYPDPDQFHPMRSGSAPLTFGHGAHYCLGAPLARLETQWPSTTAVGMRSGVDTVCPLAAAHSRMALRLAGPFAAVFAVRRAAAFMRRGFAGRCDLARGCCLAR